MAGWLGGVVRADIRRRRGSLAVLTVLVAVAGAFVLAPIAGARRTTSALDRSRQQADASDATIQYEALDGDADVRGLLADLPSVTAVGEIAVALLVPDDGDFDTSEFSYGNFSVVPVDGAYGTDFERGRLVAGERPDLDDPLSVAVSTGLAERLRLAPGDDLPIVSLSPEQLECVFTGCPIEAPEGPRLDLHVAGVQRFPSEAFGDGNPQQMLLTPAFARRYLDEVGGFGNLFHVRLDGGVDAVDRFRDEVAALAERRGDPVDGTAVVGALDEAVGIVDASSFAGRGLLVVSGLAGIALLVAFGQGAARHLALARNDRDVLRAIGVGARATGLAGGAALAVPAVAGAVGAALAAALASPLFPVGQARVAEPDPGIRVDPAVLLGGAGALAVALVAVVGIMAARPSGRRPHRPPSAGRVSVALPPVPALGVRAASRAGVGATPPGQAVAGVAAAAALACGAVVFVASLDRFVGDPARDGWSFTWEVAQGSELDGEASLADARAVAGQDGVVGVTVARIADGPDLPDGLVQAYGTQPVLGEVRLTLVEGRPPTADDEVALGAETARDAGMSVGDRIDAPSVLAGSVELRVVGVARFPLIATDRPDQGYWLTTEGLARIAPETSSFPTLLVDVDPAADQAQLRARLEVDHPYVGARPQPSTDVASLAQIVRLPTAIAGLAVFVGIGALAHALLLGTRARRAELALLRSIGMRRGAVAATVTWHALALVVAGVAIGLPLGLVAGQAAWAALARSIGVAADPLVPLAVLLVVPAAVLVGLALAALPGRRATSGSVGAALRGSDGPAS